MPRQSVTRILGLLVVLCAGASCADTGRATLLLASTTSLHDSGLLDELIPAFETAHPSQRVRLVAVGSGHALELGRRRDADVLLVHSPADEERFMAAGHGVQRLPVMRNDYALAGPPEDPANVRGVQDVTAALRRIAAVQAPFISRGDSSGTHRRELALWRAALGSDAPEWRTDIGQGMGEALGIAAERRAYTLTDRATLIAMSAALRLEILVQNGPALENVYSVITVTNAHNGAGADLFTAWIASPAAARIIASFGRQRFGTALFTPAAAPAGGP